MLVAGPACYICDSCVDLAFDIVAEWRESGERGERPWVERALQALRDLYQGCGDAGLDSKLREVLEEPGADERLHAAGEAARRMIGEVRDIVREFAAAARPTKKTEDM